jgi:hypothetical protein
MALSFLQDMGTFASGAQGGDLISGIVGLLKGRSADKYAKQSRDLLVNRQPSQAETRANSLYEALLQPNNSLVRSQQEEGTRLGIEGLLTQIREMQNADRRSVARGRRGGTFSDPERRDEFLDYSISRGLPYIQQQALENARTNIGNQANSIKGFIPTQDARISGGIDARLKYNDYANKQTGKNYDALQGGISDILKAIQNRNTRTY